VLGRRRSADLLPPGLIERLLLRSGRPVVIAPESPPARASGTIVVGWKESAAAARALAGALPLLECAERVVLLGVAERAGPPPAHQGLHDLARQLGWHGIRAEVSLIEQSTQPVAAELTQAAARLHADLLVIGGFGRAPARELIFGGVTQSLMESAELAVLMVH
jgi:nucleotide-binding universal stress UspA family protein